MKRRDNLMLVRVSATHARLEADEGKETSSPFPLSNLNRGLQKALTAQDARAAVWGYVDPDESLDPFSPKPGEPLHLQFQGRDLSAPPQRTNVTSGPPSRPQEQQRGSPQEASSNPATKRVPPPWRPRTDTPGRQGSLEPQPKPQPQPQPQPQPLCSSPELDRNPYNFVPFMGEGPWRYAPEGGEELYSGRIRLTYQAVSPLSIREIWHDASGDLRHAIPGSSLKGAVRTVLEGLVNSRMGVFEVSRYQLPIPYRRRIADAYVILERRANGDLVLERCKVGYGYADPLKRIFKFTQPGDFAGPGRELNGVHINEGHHVDLRRRGPQAIAYRANLFWVDRPPHTHKQTHLLIERRGSAPLVVPAEEVERWLQHLEHAAYKNHLEHVEKFQKITRVYYAQAYYGASQRDAHTEEALEQLRALESGTVLFGKEEQGELKCFGRNVHFMYPSRKSVAELAAPFAPRDKRAILNEETDLAEHLFGFAGVVKDGGEPRRGRVRFGTFWGPRVEEMPARRVQLEPLTSPETRAKARSLYLEPTEDGRSGSYDDDDARLRGRKVYWHQRGETPGAVAQPHLRASRDKSKQPSEAFQGSGDVDVLDAGASLDGEVHFMQLTAVELGALLLALNPALLRGGENGGHLALSLGKGKPYGLGAVVVQRLELERRDFDRVGLDSSSGKIDRDLMERARGALRRWVEERAGRPFEACENIRALVALLRLPTEISIRTYPSPESLGWMPRFGNAAGEPDGGRPIGMKRACEVTFSNDEGSR